MNTFFRSLVLRKTTKAKIAHAIAQYAMDATP
jgi:hypothetical protein